MKITRIESIDPNEPGWQEFQVSRALFGVDMGDYAQALKINGTEVVVPGHEDIP